MRHRCNIIFHGDYAVQISTMLQVSFRGGVAMAIVMVKTVAAVASEHVYFCFGCNVAKNRESMQDYAVKFIHLSFFIL